MQVTLAALCLANGLDMHEAGEVALGETIWWQSGKIYVGRDGKDVPFPKIGYSTDAGPKFKPITDIEGELPS